jgi:hypothetical protein
MTMDRTKQDKTEVESVKTPTALVYNEKRKMILDLWGYDAVDYEFEIDDELPLAYFKLFLISSKECTATNIYDDIDGDLEKYTDLSQTTRWMLLK